MSIGTSQVPVPNNVVEPAEATLVHAIKVFYFPQSGADSQKRANE